jgi:hypothetical protein
MAYLSSVTRSTHPSERSARAALSSTRDGASLRPLGAPLESAEAAPLVALTLLDRSSLQDAGVRGESHREPEEAGPVEGAPVVDSMERREVALDVVEVVDCPRNFPRPLNQPREGV